MKQLLTITAVLILASNFTHANGLLIPSEPELPALAMLNHVVDISIEDQVAITKVQQTFRNHTDRDLEATYIFPVPEGASVRDFAMWVNGKKVKGELVAADQARSTYTSIVRQTRNPALLDYIGSDMLSLKVFPVKAGGDQKIELSFTSLAKKEHNVAEYIYPLESDRASASTLEEFRITANLKSQRTIGNVYSPSHEITVERKNDHEATIKFEDLAVRLDRDFQLYFTSSDEDIGMTAIQHRPIADEDGYVMFLLSPRAELSQSQKVPRDIVFVLDTSGSMRTDDKMKQAKAALKHCVSNLSSDDRFSVVSFASTVNRYRDQLVDASQDHVSNSMNWIEKQYSGGGTAIHAALMAALKMRDEDQKRMFTIAFFTDGQPTIGETDTAKILADLEKQNTAQTRIFSFGLGDDLNAVFLDQVAEQTRAISTYVRPKQSIEAKVASFFKKIHHPVLANLQLGTSNDKIRLTEVYPPQLPDLFHGDQLVVMARYQGQGSGGIVLKGNVGPKDRTFGYPVAFAERKNDKPFVEEIWARRKVGYLLDQIRINGEQKELVDEVVALSKQYGITTPFTSYLIMPDVPSALAAGGRMRGGGVGGFGGGGGATERFEADAFVSPRALAPKSSNESQKTVAEVAKQVQSVTGGLAANRNQLQNEVLGRMVTDDLALESLSKADQSRALKLGEAKRTKRTLDRAMTNFKQGNLAGNQVLALGVELSQRTKELKRQQKLEATAVRNVASRNCMEYGGVWIDEEFNAKANSVTVKAQSDAYFRILERFPQMKEVFQLGNHLVWITPNGTALIIDTTDGNENMSDQDIDLLFASK